MSGPARNVLLVLSDRFAILLSPLDFAVLICADGAYKRCVA